MRYLIFLILAGFTGVTAWGQTSTTARPMAVNDTLTEDSTYALQEVVVRTSPVKRKADRFILSVPPAQNKDGVELLQQAPGVWLSDERISINGSSGTKVFVDNREIKLTGEMLIGYLRSLKSDDIARVEVLPMAGADKDADAQGGAIHIIMRRHTDKGFQGNLSMNASFASSLQSYQPSGSLNYHSGKWDTYGFASGTLVPQNKGDLYVTRDYVAGDKGFSSLFCFKKTVVDRLSRRILSDKIPYPASLKTAFLVKWRLPGGSQPSLVLLQVFFTMIEVLIHIVLPHLFTLLIIISIPVYHFLNL